MNNQPYQLNPTVGSTLVPAFNAMFLLMFIAAGNLMLAIKVAIESHQLRPVGSSGRSRQ